MLMREAWKAPPPHEDHEHWTSKGFNSYSHGDRHHGFSDSSESKVTVKAAHEHMIKKGFRTSHVQGTGKPIAGQKDFAGFHAWAYEKAGGPYTTKHASFDSKNGKHVRSVNYSSHTDTS
jgi:hypothetical protein